MSSRFCPRFGFTLLLALAVVPFAAQSELRSEARLDLRLASGHTVEARVTRPADAAGALPAVMLFGGFERGAGALDLVQPTRPMILASFDYPIVVPQRLDLGGSIALLPAARRAIHDSFEAIGLLHAQLLQRADVDPARVSIVGVSFGAPFAVVAAADHGIPGLVVIHGFADVPRVISHQFAWRWAEDGRAWMQPLAWLLGRSLAAYAGIPRIENHAARLRAEQKVWMLSAKDDALIPPRANESLRAAFATSPAHFDYETEDGGHLRGEKDPRIPDLLRRTERWLVANGL